MAEYERLNDSELVRESERDPAAFETLFERHAPRLRGWLAHETRDLAVANDLVAETFAQAWRSRRRFSGSGETAGAAWLNGIARNLLRQYFKRRRVETAARRRLGMSLAVPHTDDLDALLESLDAAAQAATLDAALQEVSDSQRRAIDHRVVHGRDYGIAVHGRRARGRSRGCSQGLGRSRRLQAASFTIADNKLVPPPRPAKTDEDRAT